MAERFTPLSRRLGAVSLLEVSSRAIGFLALPFVTRAVGPAAFGRLSWAVAITLWVAILFGSGLYGFGLREVAQGADRVRHTVGDLMVVGFILNGIAFLILSIYAFVGLGSGLDRTLILLCAAMLPVTGVAPNWAFVAQGRATVASMLTLATNAAYTAAIILLVRQPMDVALVPLVQLIQYVVIAIALIAIFQRYWGRIQFSWRVRHLWTLTKDSMAFQAGVALVVILNSVDIVLVRALRGNTEAGLYGAAYRLMEAGVLLPVFLLSLTVVPSITRSLAEDKGEASRRCSLYLQHLIIIAVPVGVGGMLVSEPLVTLLLGTEFSAAGRVFAILAFNLLAGGLATLFANYILLGLHEHKAYIVAVCAAIALNIGLNLVLIPRYGMTAAAATTVLTQLVVALLAALASRTEVRVHLLRYLPKPLVACLLMAVVMLLLRHQGAPLVPQIVAGGLVYVALIVALRAIDTSLIFGPRPSEEFTDDETFRLPRGSQRRKRTK